MAAIKTFLEKAMLRVGSAASAIDASSVVLVNTFKEDTTYTPARDGYVQLYGEKDTTSSPGKIAVMDKNGITLASQIEANNWYGLDVLCPVHKGDPVTIKVMNMSTVVCHTFSLIGGGLKVLYKQCGNFFERGALWPRLKNTSTRHFGLQVTSRCRSWTVSPGASQLTSRTTRGISYTQPRQTGGLRPLSMMPLNVISATAASRVRCKITPQPRAIGQGVSRALKEVRGVFSSNKIIALQNERLCSFRLLPHIEFAFGGACYA